MTGDSWVDELMTKVELKKLQITIKQNQLSTCFVNYV